MFASIALGVGVDFSLHYLYRFRRERGSGKTSDEALKATNKKTGAALRWSSVTLSLGLAALIFSDSPPNASLGALLASAMLISYGLTIAILPRALKRYLTSIVL